MRWRKVLHQSLKILCTRYIKRTESLWCDYDEDGRMKDKAGNGDVEDHRADHVCHQGHGLHPGAVENRHLAFHKKGT